MLINFLGISANVVENVEKSQNFQNFWRGVRIFPELWQNFDGVLMCKDSIDSVARHSAHRTQPSQAASLAVASRAPRRRRAAQMLMSRGTEMRLRMYLTQWGGQNFIKMLSNFSKIFTNFCIQYNIFSIFQILQDSAKFCWKFCNILQNFADDFLKIKKMATFWETWENLSKFACEKMIFL